MPSADRDRRPARWVIVDSNGWLLPFRAGVRLEEQVDALVPGAALAAPSSVLVELRALVARGTPHAVAALILAERARRVQVSATGDAGVLEAARQKGAPVLTADRRLVGRVRAAGLEAIRPRDRSRLELVPPTRPRATVISATPVERRVGKGRRRG